MEIISGSNNWRQERKVLGEQLRAYRTAVGLTQEDLAELTDTHKAYISKVEKGQMNPTFDILVGYAAFFGVQYYELGNPKVPIVTFEKLPAASRRAIAKLKANKQAAKLDAKQAATVNKEAGVPGRAKQLHGLVASGFFKHARTGKEIFTKLNPAVPKKELSAHAEEISKIITTLSQGRFVKLLDKLEPVSGSAEVRFVMKDPKAIPYVTGGGGDTKAMAAEGE